MDRKLFLGCGIAAALLYVIMLVFVPMGWPGYSSATQTVSELSAIDAPTRHLWVALGIGYTLLIVLFGWGVRTAAGANRNLRIAGTILVVQGIIGPLWPPMHLRGTIISLTDTLHIVFTALNLALNLAVIALAAAGLNKRFRIYSLVTVLVFIAGGAMTSFEVPNVAPNLPTPTIGIWERMNIAANLLWMSVFALTLMRRQGSLRPGVA